MITKQDLETLQRLYTPVGKILLEHLREDHGHWSPIVLHQEQAKTIRQQAKVIREQSELVRTLRVEADVLSGELDFLKSANPFYDINQQQAKRIQELRDEVDETIEEFNSLKSDYIVLREIKRRLELKIKTRSIF